MAEVDKTGLDILCTGKGDVYVPPKGGLSVCILGDKKTILICDSKTDKCTKALMQPNDDPTAADGMVTFRLLKLLKELNDRVDRLESKSSGRK